MPGGNDRNRGKSNQRQSLSEQLLAAAQQQNQQSGGSGTRPHGASQSGGRQSLSDQLLSAAREQQAGQQSSGGGSWSSSGQGSWGGAGQSGPTHHATPGQAGLPQSGGGQSGSRPNFLLPLVVIIAFVVFIGGFGGSCMSNPGGLSDAGSMESLFGGSSGGGSSGGIFGSSEGLFGNSASSGGWFGSSNAGGSYTIASDLGKGNPNDTWTVLMYVCGSNLESESTRMGGGLATSNLVELTQANLGSNVNFVIETGGAKRWQNDVVSARYLERYAMEGGYMVQKERLSSASMAKPSTLSDFISWGAKNYPADHYMLVFWDHGGGSITGVCNDDLYPYDSKGRADTLTLPEIREALKSSGTSFDVVGFDTCLMATLETAETLAPYAKFMVASEETEPGTGWDYTAWPAWLAQHPGTSGADLGTVICQTYYNKCANVSAASTATLSTIDLAKIKKVSAAFQNASDDIALATVDSSSLRKLYQGAGKSESYGNDGGLFSAPLNMVDLADLMSKTRDVVGADADAVVNAISDAVVFEAHGRNRKQASGLSVFYPLQASDKNDFYRYAEISNNTPYLQFLGVMYKVYENYDWTKFENYVSLRGEPVNERSIGIAFDQSVNPDGHVQLQITQGADQVANVELEVYISLDEINTLCFVGSDANLDGFFEAGRFTDKFNNEWLTIDGNFVSAALTERGYGYNLYYVPVYLNGERTGLVVEYDLSTSKYSVVCVWDENDASTGMAGRTGRTLETGDEVQFIFPSTNTVTGEQGAIPLGTMRWHDNPTIANEDMGDGTYAFRYKITDVLGNTRQTDFVYERYENGRYIG